MAQLQAEGPAKSPPPASPLPPEVQTEIIHGMLEKHYRAQLDQPVPALGNISPRAAAKTPAGRKKLVGWLKYLENQSLRLHGPDDPMGSYDLSWMWTELGVEGLRK